ncbi:LCP family protein [Sphaerisporangium fuscum]|uniref:LCP family protein n=1 Tax=Sphaerisporangium fuscum TaxID=2835868 RepID=UPI001BDC52E7|nr:LCP family protein [Sphaerisporangium fuscum]
MDDLTILRELGREIEHQPPAGLVRQRQRLVDRTAGVAPRRRRFGIAFGVGMRGRAGWIALAALAAVTAALLVVPTVLLRGKTVDNAMGSPDWQRPPKQSKALNILLLGTDRRPPPTGTNLDMGERSDTMILVHIPADRKNITAVSLPRDSMVKVPSCRTAGGRTDPARVDMLNSAFMTGGRSCVWKTVESTTGLHVDHVVALNFSGFKDIVDAVGGVEIDLPQAVNDPKSKLRLPAGRRMVDGETALAYVRTRYAMGDGSDISRIQRQQTFLKSLVKRVGDQLDNPERLLALLKAITKSVSTDEDFGMDEMISIARDVQKAKPRIRFVTVPWEPYPKDPNRLQWKQPEAGRLFKQLQGE